jgi:DNA polymerase-3 subunit delta
VFAVVGTDHFLCAEALARSLREWGVVDDESTSLTRVDGSRATLADVLDEVRTYSLLGDRRMVLVEDADDFISTHRKSLERYCESPASTGTLGLLCHSLPKNWRLHRIIAESGRVVTCAPLEPRQVVPWMIQRARDTYGKRLSSTAGASLRAHVGDAPGVIDAELSKLSTYVGDRPAITEEDIAALVGQHREEAVFAVIDAMVGGDVGAALAAWEQVLATDRAAPGRAIGGLGWGVRQLLEGCRLVAGGKPVPVAAKIVRTYDARLSRAINELGARALEDQLADLCQADLAIKRGLGTLGGEIEKFIVTHTRTARRRAVG